MTPQELGRQLRSGTIPPLLLLFGEEGYLIERDIMNIRRLFAESAGDLGETLLLSAIDHTPEEILGQLRGGSLFATRRLAVIKDMERLTAPGFELLLPLVVSPPAGVQLLFAGVKIDKKRKFYLELNRQGAAVEYKPLYDNQVPSFIREEVKLAGYQLDDDALELLCRRIGTGLAEIHQELEKLYLYLGASKRIALADVEALTTDSRVDTVFALSEAVAEGDVGRSFDLVDRMLDHGEAPVQILFMIVRHMRQLWQIILLQEENCRESEIAGKIKINPYFLKEMKRQASRYRSGALAGLWPGLLEADLQLKSGGSAKAVLEQVILDIAGCKNKQGG